MRGSVGGATYGNSPSGFTKRNKPIPVQPISQDRGAARAQLAFWQGQWRQLDDGERAAWAAAAANFPRINSLGITYYLSGINLYTSFNITLTIGGFSGITSPPSPYSFPGYVVDPMSYDLSAHSLIMTISDPPSSPLWYIIEGLRFGSQGISSPRGTWQFLIAWKIAIGSTIDLAPEYRAFFGVPILASKGFIRITPATNDGGQRGVTTVIPFITVP